MAIYSHIKTACTISDGSMPTNPADRATEITFVANHYDICSWTQAELYAAEIKAARAATLVLPYRTFLTITKVFHTTDDQPDWWYQYWDTNRASDRDDSAYLHQHTDRVHTASPYFTDDGGTHVRYDWQFDFLWHYNGSTYTSLYYQKNYAVLQDTNDYLYFGFANGPFREVNFESFSTWGSGLTLVWEYWDGDSWATLTVTDGTSSLSQAGKVSFDPPADWARCTVNSEKYTAFWVRVHASAVTTGPRTSTTLNAHTSCVHAEAYMQHNGTGYVYLGWNADNDEDEDGYVSDADIATLGEAYDDTATARFEYQARFPSMDFGALAYMQRQYSLNQTSAAVRTATGLYMDHVLDSNVNFDGIWLDSAGLYQWCDTCVECTSLDAAEGSWYDSVRLTLAAIQAANEGKVFYGNMSVYYNYADVPGTPDTYDRDRYGEEITGFYCESWVWTYSNASDHKRHFNSTEARCDAAGHNFESIIECRADPGTSEIAADSDRNQIYTLAGYYQCCDDTPNSATYFCYGGRSSAYSTSYRTTQHSVKNWFSAVEFNIGTATGDRVVWATGADPAAPTKTYSVWKREFTGGDWTAEGDALVLFKPRSDYTGPFTAETATTHALGGTYRKLNANGSFGSAITSIDLMGGEGAILIPYDEEVEEEYPVIVDISVDDSSISAGDSVTLSWDSENADTLTIDNGIGAVANPTGSMSISPSVTTRYTITGTNESGSSNASVVVTVDVPKLAIILR